MREVKGIQVPRRLGDTLELLSEALAHHGHVILQDLPAKMFFVKEILHAFHLQLQPLDPAAHKVTLVL